MIVKRKVVVTREYLISIDTENEIVKEYENTDSLIGDLIGYDFSDVLPVVNNGVSIEDSEVIEWDSYETKSY